MATEQNPTAGDSGASTPSDPIDRIEALLARDDGDSTGQSETTDDPHPDASNPDDSKDGAPARDDEPQITTAQLASFLGVDESEIDVDEDGTPVFKTKVDGKESAAKFADIRKSYQLERHAENRVREAAAKEAAAAARVQEAEQAAAQHWQRTQAQLGEINSINQVLQQELAGEFQAVPWDALWQENPAQARALERKFEQRQQRINAVSQTIQQRNAQAMQQAQWQQQANAQQSKEREQARVREVIPEWKDPAVAQKEATSIGEWAIQAGYDPNYLKAISDGLIPGAAVIVQGMRQAWQHATLKQSKPDVENKVRSAPKLVKPGQPTQTDGNTAALKSLKQQVRSTGGTSNKAVEAYLLATGKA
jgi:hypothetical protein